MLCRLGTSKSVFRIEIVNIDRDNVQKSTTKGSFANTGVRRRGLLWKL